MGRIFSVRINIDDMSALLDALDSAEEYADWLRGFRAGSRGHPQRDGWSAAAKSGHDFGWEAFNGAIELGAKQSANANKRWANAKPMPPHMPPHMPDGMPESCLSNNPIIQVSKNQLSKIQVGNTNFLDTPEDEIQLAKPMPPPSKPPSRHLPDFLAICPGMHVSRDNRPDWIATLEHWGWEAMVDGATTLRKQKNGQPVYHNEMTDWLANNYEPDDA